MENLVNENIKNLKPYVVPKVEYDIKLDANENPYPVPEILDDILKGELKDEIFKALWNYYPDPGAIDLREEIAKSNGYEKENIILGNGSDEIILNIMLTFLNSQKSLVIHPPTFSVYKIFAQVANGKVIEVPLDNEFELDREGMLNAVRHDDAAVTFITYPNNPTGNLFKEEVVLEIIENAKGIVVIDEAYYEFAGKSFIDLVKKYKNVAILRTFSKAYGIAGLRVGYLIADKWIIEQLDKVRLPYNLNKISQLIALKMFRNKAKFDKLIKEILNERDILIEKLKGIDGIKLYKSDTNAIFFRSEKVEEIYQELLRNKILVRKFSAELKGFLRFSIGKREENEKVYEIVKKIMG